jgi:hypothetical protein
MKREKRTTKKKKRKEKKLGKGGIDYIYTAIIKYTAVQGNLSLPPSRPTSQTFPSSPS